MGEQFKDEMLERGVSIIPVYFSEEDESDEKLKALKKEFAAGKSDTKKKGFGKIQENVQQSKEAVEMKDSKRWKLTLHNATEWKAWILNQMEQAGAKGEDCYIQVQLDGSVRSSGTGAPPWTKFLGDLPALKSIRTTFTDGVGTNY
eukprot:TRINITY_DN1915_c1_g1_i1.p1 TRINITY_DN1915_c1_g1~~TRINITY_DN1915_c1_g1_i1.p1  ORF type:complete len:146 (+),score=43.36 TRINITY_DN1915_c1_g1_i1:266-703(+)